ncbi:class I SAM-dependent methyltransferase [Anianabacter salinae]|uniref:class I SAM-dependent methyltransferase n=1 Tax=Anianabacter salinae TaxID=2851023 RepID=UPI00225DE3A2|nr:class I SAM-dependent methyltransferase [Anianabacter salinae]MBV0913473.1 class I SAM-dependent methyltransferase [Anianabacter salinae]
MTEAQGNRHEDTVQSFGSEWATFDQTALSAGEKADLFDRYFAIFPLDALPPDAEGFDMGCGSGRWASLVAPHVHRLNCIDPAGDALDVARRALSRQANVVFHHADTDSVALDPGSQDFGYSLGVLHHIPDTARALRATTRLLKPGAPFLLYLYYRFDNRPAWFRAIWHASNLLRRGIAALPERAKTVATDVLALAVYWPLSRLARAVERLGGNPAPIPLSFYRTSSVYTLRTDSRDRFGTPLEQRFTKNEIAAMMAEAGLVDIRFSEREPYWVAVARKADA